MVIIANPGAGLDARPAGVAAVLLAAALWAAGSLRVRDLRSTVGPTTATGLQMLCGGALLCVTVGFGLGTGRTSLGTVTCEGLLSIMWLTGPCATLGFAAYGRALHTASTIAVAIYPFINTVVAVAVGWALLHEPVTPVSRWRAGRRDNRCPGSELRLPTTHRPLVDQCQGSLGRLWNPKPPALAASHWKAGLLRLEMIDPL